MRIFGGKRKRGNCYLWGWEENASILLTAAEEKKIRDNFSSRFGSWYTLDSGLWTGFKFSGIGPANFRKGDMFR
jgi:hypothetical protein